MYKIILLIVIFLSSCNLPKSQKEVQSVDNNSVDTIETAINTIDIMIDTININLITADKMKTITDIDNKFEKFDIEWLKENATAISDDKIPDYEYLKNNETSTIFMGGRKTYGYWVWKFFNDSYFAINKLYYPNGNIKEKGWHFNKETIDGFKKGVWYYFDESGKLIKEIDHDEPFKFTAEDVFRFCRQDERCNLVKGYVSKRESSSIRRELQFLDYKNCVWIITNHLSGERETIILDGISGKVLSRESEFPYL